MRLIDADAMMAKPGNVRRVSEYDETGCSMEYNAIPEWAVMLAPSVDAVEIVRCKECKHRGSMYGCPMRKLVMPYSGPGTFEDCTEDEGYCHRGERRSED